MITTLKQYQAWRTGEDGRTLDEIGLTPKKISEALEWAIDKLEGHGMTTETILTDDQIEKSLTDAGVTGYWNPMSRYDVDVVRAVLQSPEIQALRRLSEALEEKIEMYDRYGPTCKFEGDPMIHAIHLEELRDAAMEQQK